MDYFTSWENFTYNWTRIARLEGSKFHTLTHFPQNYLEFQHKKICMPKIQLNFQYSRATRAKWSSQFIIFSKIWRKKGESWENKKMPKCWKFHSILWIKIFVQFRTPLQMPPEKFARLATLDWTDEWWENKKKTDSQCCHLKIFSRVNFNKIHRKLD